MIVWREDEPGWLRADIGRWSYLVSQEASGWWVAAVHAGGMWRRRFSSRVEEDACRFAQGWHEELMLVPPRRRHEVAISSEMDLRSDPRVRLWHVATFARLTCGPQSAERVILAEPHL